MLHDAHASCVWCSLSTCCLLWFFFILCPNMSLDMSCNKKKTYHDHVVVSLWWIWVGFKVFYAMLEAKHKYLFLKSYKFKKELEFVNTNFISHHFLNLPQMFFKILVFLQHQVCHKPVRNKSNIVPQAICLTQLMASVREKKIHMSSHS